MRLWLPRVWGMVLRLWLQRAWLLEGLWSRAWLLEGLLWLDRWRNFCIGYKPE